VKLKFLVIVVAVRDSDGQISSTLSVTHQSCGGTGGADRPGWHHPRGWNPKESRIFFGWIYKGHWTNDQSEGGEGVGVVTMTKKVITLLRKK